MALAVGLVVAVTPVAVGDLWPQSYVEQYQAIVESGGPSTQKVQLPFVQFMIDRAVRHINKDVGEAIFPVGGRAGERALGWRVGIPDLPAVVGMIFSLVIGIGLARWAASERRGAVAAFSILYVGAIFLGVERPTTFVSSAAITLLHLVARRGSPVAQTSAARRAGPRRRRAAGRLGLQGCRHR